MIEFDTNDNLVTEAGDKLISEASDYLVTEDDLNCVITIELSGIGGGWTNINADIRLPGFVARYGIMGNGPLDRVADTGTLMFALDNSEGNSAGLVGYYSPGHASARAGFEIGARVRLEIAYSGTTYYKFLGTIEEIEPVPGAKQSRLTHVVVVDWMDEAAKHKLTNIAAQESKRADELIETILGNMTRQPESKTLATGIDTFPYALDNARDESTTAMRELQKIAQSELGFIYVKGDTSAGGNLTFQNRHSRPLITSPSSTINTAMIYGVASRKRSNISNRFNIKVYPRAISGSAIVLWTLQNTPLVRVGETVTIDAAYVDPDQKAARVGAKNLITPVATTDYTMNTASDGSGTNLTSNFTVTTIPGGNAARFTITNNSGFAGYITKLQIRGTGIYTYEGVTAAADDTTSQTAYGLNAVNLDMPHQDDLSVAIDASNYLLSQWKDPQTLVEGITVIGNRSAGLLAAALSLEPGARITITETVTGVNQDFFINGVEIRNIYRVALIVSWYVTPADLEFYWILDTAGFSEVGTTTRLGY